MNFPKFWAQASHGGFSSWRWSDQSVEDARIQAHEAATRLAARFKAEGRLTNRYGYADRPLREPVLQELRDASGRLSAAVTRNSYGCRVLNTEQALFVDVDLPSEGKAQSQGILSSLFGRKPAAPPSDAAAHVVSKAEEWAHQHPGWSWRVYRTAAGVRLLATHALFDPADPICDAVFSAMDADPLYRKLCETQKCFRARLTPKPWRCDINNPPSRWPFDQQGERYFNEWDALYQKACRDKATCKLLSTGSGAIHPELQQIVALHDDVSRAMSSYVLA